MADEIDRLLELVTIQRTHIHLSLKRIAVFGNYISNHFLIELQDHRTKLADLKQQLAALGHIAEDNPGDIGNPTDIFRTTQEEALALLATMPTDALPEPRQDFAPGSRRHDRVRNHDFVGREPELRIPTFTP